MKSRSSIYWPDDEREAIERESARLGISENGFVRMAVRVATGLPLPAEWERRRLRDQLASGLSK